MHWIAPSEQDIAAEVREKLKLRADASVAFLNRLERIPDAAHGARVAWPC